jgi:hypothetical protein
VQAEADVMRRAGSVVDLPLACGWCLCEEAESGEEFASFACDARDVVVG